MLLALLAACDLSPEPAEGSNLCGTIDAPSGAAAMRSVWIGTVAEGHTACESDTGGGWWGDTVLELETNLDTFEAEVEPGSYAVEVTAGNYSGCAAADVPDESTCAADVLVELGYMVPVDKPNVYLYPEAPTNVRVAIPAWKQITESEPRYPIGGWNVRAFPDGRLATKVGPRDFLFYELVYDVARFQTSEGWCVPGALAQPTIEDAMADMGFLANEIADFAEAWDASFPKAEWITVYPQVDDLSALVVEPTPAHMLRAWFLVADGCDDVVPPQLPTVPRVGYHASEWGIAFRAPLDRGEIVVEGWR